jgi:hypothetical protein
LRRACLWYRQSSRNLRRACLWYRQPSRNLRRKGLKVGALPLTVGALPFGIASLAGVNRSDDAAPNRGDVVVISIPSIAPQKIFSRTDIIACMNIKFYLPLRPVS